MLRLAYNFIIFRKITLIICLFYEFLVPSIARYF
ncbi:hypothetical protein BVRB_2g027700 [Beta vulgaris subsp. vulgaris]|nr:hypothetical protein BVRB_2g027700 [Beta vulgaris subsp. vulgaris]